MTATTDGLQELTTAMCRIVLSGIRLDEPVLRFAESTLGLDTVQAVQNVLHSQDHPERECLLDLLLSPSREQRLELEPLLSVPGLSIPSEDQVVQRVLEICPKARIILPDGQRDDLDLDPDMLQGFVRRLHIQRILPPILQQAVSTQVPEDQQMHLRVRMRTAATPLTGSRAEFLAAVLTHVSVQSSLFEDTFEFALAFVQECAPDEDMARALAAKKELLEHSLDRAAFLERQRRTQAMESLLMQRMPMLCIDTEAANRELKIINDLCLALYGHLPGGGGPAWQEVSYP